MNNNTFYIFCVIFKVGAEGMSKAAILTLVNDLPYSLFNFWGLSGGIDNSMCLCSISASPANLLEHGLHIVRYPINDNI